jgi:enediyne biosynthesis protein E4
VIGGGRPALALLIAGSLVACTAGAADDRSASGPTDAAEPAAPATAEVPVVDADIEQLTCWAAPASGRGGEIQFEDVTAEYGLIDPLVGMYGHAAAWGDVDGDGSPDLFVGTFADRPEEEYRLRGAAGPSPDVLLRSTGAAFEPGDLPEAYGRTSGAVFADLTGDGQLDLVAARNWREGARRAAPTTVYANRGGGRFEPVDESGIDPSIEGRSVGVLDYDGDSLLDLFMVEDIDEGVSSRLYRNLGDHRFEDVTEAAGLPVDVYGLGLATGDVNLDGWTDLFVGGSNRLFVGTGEGFDEVASDVFAWETYGDEDLVAGAVFGDLNRDGWPDLVVGHHYNSTVDFGEQVPVRLYVNRTAAAGDAPEFVDVTDEAGLVGLPTKAPDLRVVDLDNDGWPDLMTTASADDGAGPAVFRHTGEVVDGVPRFEPPTGLGDPQYWISGPLADVDRDGLMDLLLVEWYPDKPSLLLRNTSDAGHWVSVSVGADLGGGVGTTVVAYEAGAAGEDDRMLGSGEITASAGYTSGHELIVHLGLGESADVDLVVTPPRHDPIVLTKVPVDRHLRLPAGC